MKFLGRDPPESSLPASDRAPSEGEGETGGAGRTFSIFPAHHRKTDMFDKLAQSQQARVVYWSIFFLTGMYTRENNYDHTFLITDILIHDGCIPIGFFSYSACYFFIHHCYTLLAQLNGMEPSLTLLVTLVHFLQWHEVSKLEKSLLSAYPPVTTCSMLLV